MAKRAARKPRDPGLTFPGKCAQPMKGSTVYCVDPKKPLLFGVPALIIEIKSGIATLENPAKFGDIRPRCPVKHLEIFEPIPPVRSVLAA